LGRLFNNKALFLGEQIVKNYLLSFSPEFLFLSGGSNSQHNIPDFGNLYKIEGVLFLVGLFLLFYKKEKTAWFWLFWIIIAPIAGSLTKDAPHSARDYAMIPAIYIVITYGFVNGVNLIKNTGIKRLTILFIGLAFMLDLGIFSGRYFILFPFKSYKDWGLGYKEMILKLDKFKANYNAIFISRPDYSPYIYYVFYNQSSPAKFQSQAQHYDATNEGFTHVESFDGITYKKIDWTNELAIPNRLYIDWVESIPSGATNSAILITKERLLQLQKIDNNLPNIKIGDYVTSKILDQVLAPDKTPIFYLIETRIGTPSASTL
jgi:hypothetical protein